MNYDTFAKQTASALCFCAALSLLSPRAMAMSFGNQVVNTESASQTLSVNNPNSRVSIVFTLTISTKDFVGKGGTCSLGTPTSLGPNRSCTLKIAFSPKSKGAKSATVDYQPIAKSKYAIEWLTGQGTLPRALSFTIGDRATPFARATGVFIPSISFKPSGTYGAPKAGALVTGDFNGDTFLDFVVLSPAGGAFFYLEGKPDGTVRPPVPLSMAAVTSPGTCDLIAGDFNRDDQLDIVVVCGSATGNSDGWGNQVAIYLGDGRGGFVQPGFHFTTGGADVAVASGDFNEDGWPDLAVGSLDSGAVGIHLGKGDGSFANAVLVDTGAAYVSAGSRANAIVVADMNRDQHADLVVADAAANSVSVLLGDGKGAFGLPSLLPVGVSPVSMSVADLNQDGFPDIVSVLAGGHVSVGLGAEGGKSAPAIEFPVGAGMSRVFVADFDKDGHLDVAAVSLDTLTLLSGDGTGKLPSRFDFNLAGIGNVEAVGDFNFGELPDLAIPLSTAGAVGIFLNTIQK